MNVRRHPYRHIAASIVSLLLATSGSAEVVTVTFNLAVETLEIGNFPSGVVDPTFVPFTSTATLNFDSSWVEGYTSAYPGYTATVANFAGQNQFTSGLTPSLPWGAPFPSGADVEYDRASYVHNTFNDPGTSLPENNWLFWDKRHHYNDQAAMLEYRHAYALQSYPDTVYPIAPDPDDFRTDDLMAYLLMMQAEQIPMHFIEYGLVYDYQAHQYVDAGIYRARATIAGINAPSIVPLPSALGLFAAALAVMGGMRRKAGR